MVEQETVTAPEIAERYGRALKTIQKQWMPDPTWPSKVGRRGRWAVFDAAEVERVVREHFLREPTAASGDPEALLTVAEIASYTGLSELTVRADISRGRIQREPDDVDAGGVKRWKRSTIDAAMAGRRRYRRE